MFSVVSTFSGCGGSSLGYQMADGKILLAVEWDDNAVETYHLNFSDTPIYHGDIAKLSVEDVLERTGLKPGELDVFDGSPPCQGFSTAGKRNFDDSRNQLFKEYVRLLRGLRPKVFVMENVSGMIKGQMKLIFVEILKELKASGYRVKARVLNAKYFNVPQSRERIIFIGVREDLGIEPSHPVGNNRVITVRETLLDNDFDNELTLPQRKIWENIKPGENGTATGNPNSWFNFTRLDPLKVAPTICKGTGNAKHAHWQNPVALGVSGYRKLASFPEGFRFVGEYNESKSRIGNSVPPLFMKAIAAHIRDNILNQSASTNS